jgi:hypothetical protein
MANEISIIIKATDKATGELAKVKNASDGFKKSMVSLGVAVGVVTGAVVAAQQAWKAVVDPLIKYNKTILDSARATGMTTEELSRLAEVAGDIGVELGAVEKALKMMTKRGLDPSIDAIANLADKANAMSSASERAAYLSQVFGKSWATLDPLLQQGGAAIKQLTGEIESGIVVTEEEIRQTERARLAIEKISDAYISARNNLALFILTGIEAEIESTTRANDITARRAEALKRLNEQGIRPTTAAVTAMAGSIERVNRLEELGKQKGEELGGAYEFAAEAADELTQAQVLMTAAEAIAAGNTQLAEDIMTKWRAADTLEKKLTSITDLLAGGMSIGGIESKLAAEAATLQSLATPGADMLGGPGARAPAPVLTPVKMPAPDLTEWNRTLADVEMQEFPNLQKNMEAGITKPVDDAFRVLRSMDQRTITTKWDKYETTYKRTVRLGGGGGGAQEFAGGADFVVPPGYPNDSFPMAVTSGEHVVVTPAGNDNSRTININGGINVSNDADRVRFDKQMRDWLGA